MGPSAAHRGRAASDAWPHRGPPGAAALLQINPHTLRAKMRKLEIDWAHFREAPQRRVV